MLVRWTGDSAGRGRGTRSEAACEKSRQQRMLRELELPVAGGGGRGLGDRGRRVGGLGWQPRGLPLKRTVHPRREGLAGGWSRQVRRAYGRAAGSRGGHRFEKDIPRQTRKRKAGDIQ